jgi:hypothetical protein
VRHWQQKHAPVLGSHEPYAELDGCQPVHEPSKPCDPEPPPQASATVAHNSIVDVAMQHIDRMKYDFFEKDAAVSRAKEMCRDVCAEAVCEVVRQIKSRGAASSVEELISPIMTALDSVNTVKREAAHRRQERRASKLPELKVYPRAICKRVASTSITSRRNVRLGQEDVGYAWETKIEELLERELAYDPELWEEIQEADAEWTARNKNRCGQYDEARTFRDICDGQVFAEHPCLGDPNYSGDTRTAWSGYCDDVDVPNPIGTAAGHSKLFLCFIVLLNRKSTNRLTLRSIHLAHISLASDAILAGPEVLISGSRDDPEDSASIGANFTRLNAGTTLQCADGEKRPIRGWLLAWAADGMALGQVAGTNRSFSAAHNPCNLCEDFKQFRDARDHKPFGFLRCRCPPNGARPHRPRCPCKWRLRSERRDAQIKQRGKKDEMQAAGITTFDHGFVRVPHVRVSCLGPKDPMHTFLEGCTRHRSAYTLFMIYHTGRATKEQLRDAILKCDFGGGVNPLFRPGYVSNGIYTATKVTLPSGGIVWGPHKEAKLNYTAHGCLVFSIFSLEILKKYFPEDDPPVWWKAWVMHVHVISTMMRTEFTMADLYRLEDMLIEDQELHFSVPEYHDTWVPKYHWAQHLALDIFRWAPPRFLWCMLMEMKNAQFKRGCKRSNNHNPTKSTALYWVEKSAHELKNKKAKQHCDTSDSKVKVLQSGLLSSFSSVPCTQALLTHMGDGQVCFFNFIKLRGAHISLNSHVFVGSSHRIYAVLQLVSAHNSHFVWLAELGDAERDPVYGSWSMETDQKYTGHRLLELVDGVDVTPLWCVSDTSGLRFIERW